jgi:hypothetical protein
MATLYRIKIVPRSDPKADGEWRDISKFAIVVPPNPSYSWIIVSEFIEKSGLVPENYVLIAYDTLSAESLR